VRGPFGRAPSRRKAAGRRDGRPAGQRRGGGSARLSGRRVAGGGGYSGPSPRRPVQRDQRVPAQRAASQRAAGAAGRRIPPPRPGMCDSRRSSGVRPAKALEDLGIAVSLPAAARGFAAAACSWLPPPAIGDLRLARAVRERARATYVSATSRRDAGSARPPAQDLGTRRSGPEPPWRRSSWMGVMPAPGASDSPGSGELC